MSAADLTRRLKCLSAFVGCGVAECRITDPACDGRLNLPGGGVVGWRCRPEIATAFCLCALFAARSLAPGRTLSLNDFSAAPTGGPDPAEREAHGLPGAAALDFCRRLADATGTHFDVGIRDGSLCLYMDFLTYDAQIPEGLKADPSIDGEGFVPTVFLRLTVEDPA